MKNIIYFLTIIILIFASSCKKDDIVEGELIEKDILIQLFDSDIPPLDSLWSSSISNIKYTFSSNDDFIFSLYANINDGSNRHYLCKFDGTETEIIDAIYTSPGQLITDTDNNIWFHTTIDDYDETTNQEQRKDALIKYNEEGIPVIYLSDIIETDNTWHETENITTDSNNNIFLWKRVYTEGENQECYIIKFDGSTWTTIDFPDDLYYYEFNDSFDLTYFTDSDGYIWYKKSDTELVRYKDNTSTIITTPYPFNSSSGKIKEFNNIIYIQFRDDYDTYFYKYENNELVLAYEILGSDVSNIVFNDYLIDNSGNFFGYGAQYGDIFKKDTLGELTPCGSGVSSGYLSFYLTSKNEIWIAGYTGGIEIYKFDGNDNFDMFYSNGHTF